MIRSKRVAILVSVAFALVSVSVPAQAVTHAASGKFKNCKALNAKYSHGVGRPGAKDHTKSKRGPVVNFTVDAKVYAANSGLDRDKDGVACEKH
jgi:hypothetical protein